MLKKILLLCSSVLLLNALSISSKAQSITAGDVTGTVTDPTGAAVPNASVTLTNVDTNTAQKDTTNSQGNYRFAFVSPGNYKITVNARGFQAQDRPGLAVSAGQPTTVNVQLAVATASTTVDVVAGSSAIQTDNADVSTTFNREVVQDLPNPGGDITYYAQTAPGVVMNTQAGYGNFVADGMPGISNLFTINGGNFNDAFEDNNNSGASNLLLGSNDVDQVNVITSPYSAQYGQYAGAQVSYITKSGTNQFHGDAVYMWNGRAMNANQFFSNEVGQPTPFNNYNQWATGVQGPIWKNRTFFSANYEGVNNLLPTASNLTFVPSPQFQAATLANLAADGNGAEIPFYNQIFKIYNSAPGVGSATPVPGGGCADLTTFTAGPCALEFRTTPPNTNKEYQWSGRVDHNFSDKDRGYIRIWRDNGFQPTYTSPFGATFNEQSNQPQMAGQVSEVHTLGPNTLNQLNGSVYFYAALFVPTDASGALSALPTYLGFAGNALSPVGALGEPPIPPGFFFPQGRRVFQWQVIDDFSHVRGQHTFRAGVSELHDYITDLDFESLGGPIHGLLTTDMTDFFNGGGPSTSLFQGFPSSPEEAFSYNTIGGYVADDWKVSERLTVSLNLRLEHYSDPSCSSNCFSQLASTFTGAPNANAGNIPYNQLILAGEHNAYPNTQAVVWEPRVGIAWKPFHDDSTVIRTGAGVFADMLPGGLAEDAAFNAPGLNAFTLSSPTATIAPGAPGSLFTLASQSNQALVNQFRSGGSFNSISAAVPGFVSPNFDSFPNYFHQPTYYRWNFEIQHSLPGKMVASANYSGMHGTHIPVADEGLNAYCPPITCPAGFAGLPGAPPNPSFATVTQYMSAGDSSYNGLVLSLQRKFSSGVSFNVNYTWSHALDDVSNGGIANEQFSILATNSSIQTPQNPFNIRGNYGNSDYDVRHYISANFVLTDMFRHAGFRYGPNRIFGGWTLSSNWFFRTGLPFSVIDTADSDALIGYNDGGPIFASPVGHVPQTCTSAVNSPCLTTSQFAPAGALTGFGTGGRNQYYGPHFFDVDMALMKDIAITEHVTFSFGAHAYNLFNHPNFDQPVADINNPSFGSSIAAVGPPTSLLGSFVGAGSSPRFVEIKGLIRFLRAEEPVAY